MNLAKYRKENKENIKGDEVEKCIDKKDYFDKISSHKESEPKESEYSESFRQLQQELLNDNIEYIIDDKGKKDSNTYLSDS